MKSKLAVLLVALFVLIPVARSAPLSTYITGAVIQSSEYDETKHSLTVHILNTSHKDISALVVRSKDGYDVFDFLSAILAGRTGFAPGEVITEKIGTDSPQVEITAVTYADSTAEVTDQHGFDILIRGRTAHLLAIQKVNEIVRASLADSSIADHHAAILAQVNQARVAMKKPSEALGSTEASFLETETLYLPQTDAGLVAMTKGNDERIAAIGPHTKPEVQK